MKGTGRAASRATFFLACALMALVVVNCEELSRDDDKDDFAPEVPADAPTE